MLGQRLMTDKVYIIIESLFSFPIALDKISTVILARGAPSGIDSPARASAMLYPINFTK